MSLAYTSDPRRAARSDGEYEGCSLLMGPIRDSDCERRSSSRQNELACKRCPSPFRSCIPCFTQHIPRHAQGAVDAKTGLCSFHEKHGPRAVRTYVPPEALKQEAAKPEYAPLDPRLVAMLPREVIDRAALEEFPHLARTHKELLKLVARGVRQVNRLALDLNTEETTLYVTMNRLAMRFGINVMKADGRDRSALRMTAFSLIYQRAKQN